MIACVFAGQGSQFAGMGRPLAEQNAAARLIYEEASTVAGLNLLALSEEQLALTRYAQLAIVSLSLASFAALKAEGVLDASAPLAFAGFSLGEYAALSAAGVLSLTDVLNLVAERSRLMQQASEAQPGAMYAILGLDDGFVENLLAHDPYQGRVFPVNYNCPGQLVIAGEIEATAAAADTLKAAGAKRALKLNVSGAFHTPLMASAVPGLREFASTLSFAPPQGNLYSNRTGQVLDAGIQWPDYLAQHLCSAVRWTDEVRAMQAAGVTHFVELGPGKTLSGLIRKTISTEAVVQIEDPTTLTAAVEALKV